MAVNAQHTPAGKDQIGRAGGRHALRRQVGRRELVLSRRARRLGLGVAGEGVEAQVVRPRDRRQEPGGEADHAGVVGAQADRRQRELQALGLTRVLQDAAQTRVGGDAAGDGHVPHALGGGDGHRLLDELAHDGRLVRGGDVGAMRLDLLPFAALEVVEQRRLEAAEAEVAASAHGARKTGEARIAPRRQLVQLPAARIAEAQHPGSLVEGLAGRVVHGLGGDAVAHALLHHGQQRVPAAGDEAHERRLHPEGVVGGDVPLQVIDGDQGQPAPVGDGLRRRQPDEQGADEPRALSDGDRREVAPAHAGPAHRLGDHRVGQLGVAA